ncbi:MAG: ABC transporter substrate-binding protein, partial [Dehalococcoidia bacterium]|nr:ABC transporter substrate-binding protein [Dehalococcoidia bacterium]
TTDFSPIVTKIKEIKPDAIAYSSIGAEFLSIGKEMERQGIKIPAVTGTQAWAGPFIKQLGSAVDGWIVIGTFDKDDPDPAVKAWVARFDALKLADPGIAAKDTPTTLEIHIYDTMMAVADIMRKANITADMPLPEARTKIRDGFQNLKSYKGVKLTFSMTSTGDVEWQPLAFPFVAEKGEWKTLK